MRGFNIIVWAVVLTSCITFWMSVVSCATTTATPAVPQLLEQAKRDAIDFEHITPLLVAQAASEASYVANQWASAHVRPMPELADVVGGLPIVMTPQTRPRTGSEFLVNWLTRPVGAYPSGRLESWDPANHPGSPEDWPFPSIEVVNPGIRPDLSCALFLTLKEPGPAQPIPGGAGGMLQVPPDYVMVPQRVDHLQPWHRPGVPFEFVHNDRGQIMLRVTLPDRLDGLRVWCQLVVADTRVPAGCVSTAMVEINVGKL